MEKEWYYPDSLGRLYGSVTRLLGFRAGADEHKVQWLSASGDERFVPLFREVLSHTARLDPAFFDASRQSGGGFSAHLYDRLGIQNGSEVPVALVAAVARGAQEAVQETALALAGEGENLCLAGGLFFNALLVEFLESSGRWKNVFVQAAAGNAGTALGAVFHVWHQVRRHTRRTSDGSLLLGPSYSPEAIKCRCDGSIRLSDLSHNRCNASVRLPKENGLDYWVAVTA
jgi:carbamoyltransferase